MSVDEKLKSQLSVINLSIDELESQLDILLSQPFSETLGKLEKLQQAKVQTALPYLIYDLVFMYLKTKGVDPKNHPVINELARIKQYFDKISGAEKNIDAKEDCCRISFITHAIAQVKYNSSRPDEAGPSTQIIPKKITSKMLEREQYEKELREHMDDENEMDDIPQIFDD
ncbi:Sas10/Utp3/C1D family-domain-containing protein, partial [Flagelloscypha sp. PMI_526]